MKDSVLSEFTVPEVGTVGASTRLFGIPYEQPEPFVCKGVYALRIMDDSMEPLAREGQRVLVDPDAVVSSGDLVILNMGQKEEAWIFKRYVLNKGLHQFLSINTHRGIPAIIIKEEPDMRKAVAVVF
ncbi:MAG: S24 family peptidase [Planctomycetota bacterium]